MIDIKLLRENPELVVQEGWVRIFEKEGYRQVVEMGEKAAKPLYWILYKSKNAGLYEYLCSHALYEIMELNMQQANGEFTWSNAKEFLEQFNQEMRSRKPKDFTLIDQERKEVSLSEFYGKPMVLVFSVQRRITIHRSCLPKVSRESTFSSHQYDKLGRRDH